jgi:hypothetical protein
MLLRVFGFSWVAVVGSLWVFIFLVSLVLLIKKKKQVLKGYLVIPS